MYLDQADLNLEGILIENADKLHRSRVINKYYFCREEEIIVNNFLKKYMMTSKRNNTINIDLKLAIKTFPTVMNLKNMQKIDLLNFQII